MTYLTVLLSCEKRLEQSFCQACGAPLHGYLERYPVIGSPTNTYPFVIQSYEFERSRCRRRSSIRFDSLGGLCVELSLRDPLKLCMASVGGDDVEV